MHTLVHFDEIRDCALGSGGKETFQWSLLYRKPGCELLGSVVSDTSKILHLDILDIIQQSKYDYDVRYITFCGAAERKQNFKDS